MSAREDEIFAEVREIISETQGIEPENISFESDLLRDLGIAGDDADELLTEIDKRFAIDWNNIHLGIHFGNEGLGYPFPWMLKNDCSMFKSQPCTVRDLVIAVETGKWKGTPRIRRGPATRAAVYVVSTFQFLLLAGIGLSSLALLIYKIAG